MKNYQPRHFTRKSQIGTKKGDLLIAGHGKHHNVFGGPGADTLVAAGAHDVLHGGNGADVFAFGMSDRYTKTSLRKGKPHTHTILNFNPKEGDKIDLSHMVDDIRELKFIGTKEFSGKGGEIRIEYPTSGGSKKRSGRSERSILQTNSRGPLSLFDKIFKEVTQPKNNNSKPTVSLPPIWPKPASSTPKNTVLHKFVPTISKTAETKNSPIIHIAPPIPSLPIVDNDAKAPVVDLIPDDLPLVDIISDDLPIADLIPDDLPIVDVIPDDLPIGDLLPDDLPIGDLLPDDINDGLQKFVAPMSIKLDGLDKMPKIADIANSFTAMGKDIFSGDFKDPSSFLTKGLGLLDDGLDIAGTLTGYDATIKTIKAFFGDSNFGEVMSSLVSSTVNGVPIPGSDSYIKFTPFMNIEPSVTNIRVPFIPPITGEEISMDDMGADIDLDVHFGFDYDLTIGKQTGEFNLPAASYSLLTGSIMDTGVSRISAGWEVGYSPKFLIGEEATNKKVGISTGLEGNISTSISNKSKISGNARPYTIIKDNISGLGFDAVFGSKIKVGLDIGPELPGSKAYAPPKGCNALIVSGGLEVGAEFGVAINAGSPNTLTAESKITPFGDIGSLACGNFSLTAIPLEFQTPLLQLLEKQSMII